MQHPTKKRSKLLNPSGWLGQNLGVATGNQCLHEAGPVVEPVVPGEIRGLMLCYLPRPSVVQSSRRRECGPAPSMVLT
jgi:hypothetical protein